MTGRTGSNLPTDSANKNWSANKVSWAKDVTLSRRLAGLLNDIPMFNFERLEVPHKHSLLVRLTAVIISAGMDDVTGLSIFPGLLKSRVLLLQCLLSLDRPKSDSLGVFNCFQL
ncbi:hypothetical protein PoB_007308500 [Plakobranchus ocellatus]|uniref:Uncharacterized protein n=1 Tax=Plakobranchus ocellatus TaxID=259542 RepID=A0AAV4DRM5_9GAST|nr:hypothetical protein PoB_007308500 [Plakobranchus ocellatus]